MAGFGQIVSADPANAAAGGVAVSTDAEPAVADATRPEDDDPQAVGVVVLAAHFFLQALGDAVWASFLAADF